MRLSSRAFEDGKIIPAKHAFTGVSGGKNISLPLVWNDIPPNTKSFAITMVDPHPVARNWIHWLVINIPAGESELGEGTSGKNMPRGAKELYNSYGELGYGGPQPPKGSGPHPYVITLFALGVENLDMSANTTLAAFMQVLEGKILTTAKITGIYER